ncbi:MAG: hypothetical protein L0Y79_10885 [Chlorobi bacterium]|nr:hypothetical protein [Chlorobiota bacterium]MCI0715562.1 hypothetical protein [Chlorobiota bacterium]
MRKTNNYLITLVFISIQFLNTTDSQSQKDSIFSFFNYVFNSDSLIYNFNLEKLGINKEDSMKVTIFINNSSEDTICVLNYITTKDIVKDESKNLIIEFGGLFESSSEHPIEVRRISPNSVEKISKTISYQYFIEKNYDTYFLMKFSFGYIPHMSCLRNNEYLTNLKMKILSASLAEVSSLVFESCLERYDIVNTFYVKLEK